MEKRGDILPRFQSAQAQNVPSRETILGLDPVQILQISKRSKSWLTPLGDHNHTALIYAETLLHVLPYRIRRDNNHICLVRHTGETCADDETVLQREQLRKEQGNHVVYRDDIGTTLKKKRQSHVIETMKHIDLVV